MLFDYVKNLKMPNDTTQAFGTAQALYSICTKAERNCRVAPTEAAISVRKALEILVDGLLYEAGMHSNAELYLRINLINGPECYSDFVTNNHIRSLHYLRKQTNQYAHIRKGNESRSENPSENNATISEACDLVIRLNELISGIFGIAQTHVLPEDLPIGEYEIVKKIPKEDYEPIFGDYKYIGVKKDTGLPSYVYIRPFAVTGTVSQDLFSHRDADTQSFFKHMRSSNHLIHGTEIRAEDYTYMRYTAYEIQEDTKTLDRLIGEIRLLDLLDIICQTASGLRDISQKNTKIHHRGIRPTCIFVNRYEDEYEAKLGCFETAKIEQTNNEIQTVMPFMLDSRRENLFVHPELRTRLVCEDREWEAGDIYSLSVVFLYCLDRETVEDGVMNCDAFMDCGDELYEMMENILSPSPLSTMPNIREFLNVLENEKERMQEEMR